MLIALEKRSNGSFGGEELTKIRHKNFKVQTTAILRLDCLDFLVILCRLCSLNSCVKWLGAVHESVNRVGQKEESLFLC